MQAPTTADAEPAAGTAPGVGVLPFGDPDARHPISLVHEAPEPPAPSARVLVDLVLGAAAPAGRE
jgi:hypothetical protein